MERTRRRYRRMAGIAGGAVALAAGLEAASYPLWRSWCLNWGASGDEAAAELPGDELLPDARIVSTRAIGIGAPAGAVWPWLVQMGPGRGGVYTYDWIENLFGLGIHSVDKILPEFQDLKVGDAQRLGRKGPVLGVAVLEPERALVLRSDDGNWVWAFALDPHGATTRLVSRNRIATPGASGLSRALYRYVMEPGSLVMERKMLLGLRRRAERMEKEPGKP
jgi:hypothetical protein